LDPVTLLAGHRRELPSVEPLSYDDRMKNNTLKVNGDLDAFQADEDPVRSGTKVRSLPWIVIWKVEIQQADGIYAIPVLLALRMTLEMTCRCSL
jgi:hypothetical protein